MRMWLCAGGAATFSPPLRASSRQLNQAFATLKDRVAAMRGTRGPSFSIAMAPSSRTVTIDGVDVVRDDDTGSVPPPPAATGCSVPQLEEEETPPAPQVPATSGDCGNLGICDKCEGGQVRTSTRQRAADASTFASPRLHSDCIVSFDVYASFRAEEDRGYRRDVVTGRRGTEMPTL